MIRMTLVFSSDSGNHCSDVQRPALKLKVTLPEFSSVFRRPKLGKHGPEGVTFFFLYCGVDSPFLCVEVHFSFTLCNYSDQ